MKGERKEAHNKTRLLAKEGGKTTEEAVTSRFVFLRVVERRMEGEGQYDTERKASRGFKSDAPSKS
jgi:hypothetical protein